MTRFETLEGLVDNQNISFAEAAKAAGYHGTLGNLDDISLEKVLTLVLWSFILSKAHFLRKKVSILEHDMRSPFAVAYFFMFCLFETF